MRNYVPFLKLKQGETLALAELDSSLIEGLVPFVDIARGKPGMAPAETERRIRSSCQQFSRHCSLVRQLYLDDFDLPVEPGIDGANYYKLALEEFIRFSVIPVIGTDRSARRNQIALEHGRTASGTSTIAVRVQLHDLQVEVVSGRLDALVDEALTVFGDCHLIVDCRVVDSSTPKQYEEILSSVAGKLRNFSRVIVAGSIITASIRDLSEPSQERVLERSEVELFRITNRLLGGRVSIYLGDYGVVSPDYSEVDITPELFRKVTAPKVLYSFGLAHYLCRGTSLERAGNGQYRSIFRKIIEHQEGFFRGAAYSWGDQFFLDKAHGAGKDVTPASVIKPTTNAHLTFMLRDFLVEA